MILSNGKYVLTITISRWDRLYILHEWRYVVDATEFFIAKKYLGIKTLIRYKTRTELAKPESWNTML